MTETGPVCALPTPGIGASVQRRAVSQAEELGRVVPGAAERCAASCLR